MPLRHGNAWEYLHNDKPKCPHCDAAFDVAENEAWELYDKANSPVTIRCPSCDKKFSVSISCTFSYDTDEQEEEAEPIASAGGST